MFLYCISFVLSPSLKGLSPSIKYVEPFNWMGSALQLKGFSPSIEGLQFEGSTRYQYKCFCIVLVSCWALHWRGWARYWQGWALQLKGLSPSIEGLQLKGSTRYQFNTKTFDPFNWRGWALQLKGFNLRGQHDTNWIHTLLNASIEGVQFMRLWDWYIQRKKRWCSWRDYALLWIWIWLNI